MREYKITLSKDLMKNASAITTSMTDMIKTAFTQTINPDCIITGLDFTKKGDDFIWTFKLSSVNEISYL